MSEFNFSSESMGTIITPEIRQAVIDFAINPPVGDLGEYFKDRLSAMTVKAASSTRGFERLLFVSGSLLIPIDRTLGLNEDRTDIGLAFMSGGYFMHSIFKKHNPAVAQNISMFVRGKFNQISLEDEARQLDDIEIFEDELELKQKGAEAILEVGGLCLSASGIDQDLETVEEMVVSDAEIQQYFRSGAGWVIYLAARADMAAMEHQMNKISDNDWDQLLN